MNTARRDVSIYVIACAEKIVHLDFDKLFSDSLHSLHLFGLHLCGTLPLRAMKFFELVSLLAAWCSMKMAPILRVRYDSLTKCQKNKNSFHSYESPQPEHRSKALGLH